MPPSNLSPAALHDEEAALAHIEAVLWPNGPVCPHCGATDRIYELKGKATRLGLRKCGHCRKQFTVTVGTVMERSHVPLHKWVPGDPAPFIGPSIRRIGGHRMAPARWGRQRAPAVSPHLAPELWSGAA